MQTLSTAENDTLLERRQNTIAQSELWDRLSLSQKFSTSSLNQFGYDLAFIRQGVKGSSAILLCGSSIATVSVEGDVDTNPSIAIR